MSAQLLGPKALRRMARVTGVDNIVRGWAHGGYWHGFVTADHRHGEVHRTTGEWQWAPADALCYTSCSDLPPVQAPPASEPQAPPTEPGPAPVYLTSTEYVGPAGARAATVMLPLAAESDGVLDATGCHWDSPVDALWIGALGMCGCGSSEQLAADAVAVLRWRATWGAAVKANPGRLGEPWHLSADAIAKASPPPEVEGGPDGLYMEVLLNLLNRAGLLEHGGTVNGSWPTDLGDQWLVALGPA